MRVRCACFVEVTEEADLPALDWDSLPRPVMVMGGGSNLLFTRDFPGTVLHYGEISPLVSLGRNDKNAPSVLPGECSGTVIPGDTSSVIPSRPKGAAEESHFYVTLPAGTVFDDFCAWAASEGLWGPENLSLIPGEVGASAVQNIGAYGVEAKDIIAGIRAWDCVEGRFVDIDPATCEYGYRTSKFKTDWKGRYIITAVTYRLSCDPQPRLDYGGLRKALESRGVSVIPPGDSVPLRFTPAPPTALRRAPPPILVRGWTSPRRDDTHTSNHPPDHHRHSQRKAAGPGRDWIGRKLLLQSGNQ